MYRKKLPEKINGFAVKKGVKMKALLLMIECVLYIEKKPTRPISFFFLLNEKKISVLPSIAGVPMAVGIISPDVRMASNLDIRTDNLLLMRWMALLNQTYIIKEVLVVMRQVTKKKVTT